MKFMKVIPCLALVTIVSMAHADRNLNAAHAHLLDIDLSELTQAGTPAWRVPAAMASSHSGAVHVHRPLGEVEGGYSLAAVYVWQDDAWQPAGWRMMHPTVDEKWLEERVLQDSAQLPGERFAVNPAFNDGPGLLSENYCTDAPDTHGPDSTHGHEVGDTQTNTWTNEFQGCYYETDFEVQILPNNSLGWVVVDFRFQLQNDDGDEEGDEETK